YDVLIGGQSASDVVNSATQLTVTTPPHNAGDWDVVVRAAAGDSPLSASARFTYNAVSAPSISSLTSSSGSAFGGYAVTIAGSNFTGASAVCFSSVAASFVVNSDSEI